MKKALCTSLVCLLSATLLAEPNESAIAQQTEMKKLSWLVGTWKGSGWIQAGPDKRREFTQTQTVQSKLDGMVLVLEGETKENGVQVHTTLVFASYDDEDKTFRWRGFSPEGRKTDVVATAGTHTLEFTIPFSELTYMRYTSTLNDKGEWFEIGETSQDGRNWQKFLEITLQREK